MARPSKYDSLLALTPILLAFLLGHGGSVDESGDQSEIADPADIRPRLHGIGASLGVIKSSGSEAMPDAALVVGAPWTGPTWTGSIVCVESATGLVRWKAAGAGPHAELGSSLRVVEDVNRDGVRDVVALQHVGEMMCVTVISGKDGAVLLLRPLIELDLAREPTSAWLCGTTQPDGQGSSVGLQTYAQAERADFYEAGVHSMEVRPGPVGNGDTSGPLVSLEMGIETELFSSAGVVGLHRSGLERPAALAVVRNHPTLAPGVSIAYRSSNGNEVNCSLTLPTEARQVLSVLVGLPSPSAESDSSESDHVLVLSGCGEPGRFESVLLSAHSLASGQCVWKKSLPVSTGIGVVSVTTHGGSSVLALGFPSEGGNGCVLLVDLDSQEVISKIPGPPGCSSFGHSVALSSTSSGGLCVFIGSPLGPSGIIGDAAPTQEGPWLASSETGWSPSERAIPRSP